MMFRSVLLLRSTLRGAGVRPSFLCPRDCERAAMSSTRNIHLSSALSSGTAGENSPATGPSTIAGSEAIPAGQSTTVPRTGREKLKAAIRDYGSTVLLFHIASGVSLLSMWYLIISSGVDVSAVIRTLGLEGTLGKFAGGAGTFVVAYAIHKATAPLRIGLTLTASPLIVNYLRRKGIMKLKS